jgi:galactokinase
VNGDLSAARLRQALISIEPLARARQASIRIVRAPGRVNLIGEHTDYNYGLVLPAAIGLENRIAFVPTDNARVELTLHSTGEKEGFDLDAIGAGRGIWIDYVEATAWALREAGLPTMGFRGLLAGDLPIASGLSSSAALELAAAWALTGDVASTIDPLGLAQICQRGENQYVGVQCGLMDQFAVANGRSNSGLMLDCRSLEWSAIPIPEGIHLVVCHTGLDRTLAASEYNTRRAECDRAVATIQTVEPQVRSLRDVDMSLLERHRKRLDRVALARARHVVTENSRVLETADALVAGDLEAVGEIFAQSHASLRDNYDVSCFELDVMVEVAASVPGVIAARMTGAGFGGCTVNLVYHDAVARLTETVFDQYASRTGRIPRVWEVATVGGAGELPTTPSDYQ